ncbi:hypothetical protein [Dactylosporangium sp. CA-139066]|uniref:hypothetical protein n=1 Tax=Dactylosporangium sp. CA-139066 TaxID=3239930 RepID=UPI003D92B70C
MAPDSLYVYRGRGGSAGAVQPRRRGPLPAAGAAALPVEPDPVIVAHLGETLEPVSLVVGRPDLLVA